MVFERAIPNSSIGEIFEDYLRRVTTELLREINSTVDNDYLIFRLDQLCITLVQSGHHLQQNICDQLLALYIIYSLFI